jgi:glutaredoxin
MIPKTLEEKMTKLSDSMNPKTMAKAFGGVLKSTLAKMLKTPKFEFRPKKSLFTGEKLGEVDTAFYTKINQNVKTIVKRRDTMSDIAAKIHNFLQYTYEQKDLHYKLADVMYKIGHEKERNRMQNLLHALGSDTELDKKKEEILKPKEPGTISKILTGTNKLIGDTTKKLSSKFEAILEAPKGNLSKIEKELITLGIGGAVAVGAGALIGKISSKYESGNNPGSVSTGKNDKGGISYGSYQLSTNSGNADEFVKQSSFKDNFKGLKSGTKEFGEKWKEIANDPKNVDKFSAEQHDFISKKNYLPALDKAKKMGYNVEDKGVAESIWSLSMQHGDVQKVLNISKENMGNQIDKDPKKQIESLYNARKKYTKDLGMDFEKRYNSEVQDAIKESGSKLSEIDSHADIGEKIDKATKKLKESTTKIDAPVVFNNQKTIFMQGDTQTASLTFTGPRLNSKPVILEESLYG